MRLVLFIAFVILASSCSQRSKQHTHHKNIPEQAFWVGDERKGYWYLVNNIHPHKNSADITIYNEDDGKVIVSKNFTLVCEFTDEVTLIEDAKMQIVSFDGKAIKFKSIDGETPCYLK